MPIHWDLPESHDFLEQLVHFLLPCDLTYNHCGKFHQKPCNLILPPNIPDSFTSFTMRSHMLLWLSLLLLHATIFIRGVNKLFADSPCIDKLSGWASDFKMARLEATYFSWSVKSEEEVDHSSNSLVVFWSSHRCPSLCWTSPPLTWAWTWNAF